MLKVIQNYVTLNYSSCTGNQINDEIVNEMPIFSLGTIKEKLKEDSSRLRLNSIKALIYLALFISY